MAEPDRNREQRGWTVTALPWVWPAWLLSIILHLSLGIVLALTITLAPRGAAEEPARDGGIVLKHLADQQAYYEDESIQKSRQAEASSAAQAQSLMELLSERPPVDTDVLPKAPAAIGPGASRPSPVGDAASLTQGSGPSTGGGTGRTGYAHTSVFGVPGEGSKFVYVFDRSLSMDEYGGRPLRAAKKELLRSLQDLGNVQQFHIIFYNQHPRIFNPGVPGRLVFATSGNKLAAEAFVNRITADGGTNHLDALKAAIAMSPDVIFLLTDGTPEHDLNQAELREVRRRNSGRSSINVIQFADGTNPRSTLKQLAAENGGQHATVDIAGLGR